MHTQPLDHVRVSDVCRLLTRRSRTTLRSILMEKLDHVQVSAPGCGALSMASVVHPFAWSPSDSPHLGSRVEISPSTLSSRHLGTSSTASEPLEYKEIIALRCRARCSECLYARQVNPTKPLANLQVIGLSSKGHASSEPVNALKFRKRWGGKLQLASAKIGTRIAPSRASGRLHS